MILIIQYSRKNNMKVSENIRGWLKRKKRKDRQTQLGGFSELEDFYSVFFLRWWMWVTVHLSKSTDCLVPRVHLKIRCALWVITRCQRWFVSRNKCTARMRDGDRGSLCVEGVGCLGIRHFPPDFAVNLKLLLKANFYHF